VLHHLCSATADTVLRLFEQFATPLRIVAELWSFENIKSFVQEGVGMAIVPGITVRQELRDGTLVRVPVRELSIPRRTLMVYREQGYLSDSARELIEIVRAFNWDGLPALETGRTAEEPRLAALSGAATPRARRRTPA
jgi:DNA-binding transcriptional LysR family regulator